MTRCQGTKPPHSAHITCPQKLTGERQTRRTPSAVTNNAVGTMLPKGELESELSSALYQQSCSNCKGREATYWSDTASKHNLQSNPNLGKAQLQEKKAAAHAQLTTSSCSQSTHGRWSATAQRSYATTPRACAFGHSESQSLSLPTHTHETTRLSVVSCTKRLRSLPKLQANARQAKQIQMFGVTKKKKKFPVKCKWP